MERQNRTKKMTFCAMMTALSVLLLTVGSMTNFRIAMAAIAAVAAALTIAEGGSLKYGILTVLATAILAVLVVPSKEAALLYAVFFGPYTVVKNLIERLHNLPLEWVLKLAFCAAETVLLFRFAAQVAEMVPAMLSGSIWILLPVVLVVFAAYDVVFSKLIAYVMERTHF